MLFAGVKHTVLIDANYTGLGNRLWNWFSVSSGNRKLVVSEPVTSVISGRVRARLPLRAPTLD